jgi:hypothetical protein
MAFIHDWNRSVPSGDSLISLGDDLLRSDKSILEETLNTEHYFTAASASSRSAGEHKAGSARVGIGTASALSNPAPGRINYISDITDFAVALSRSSFSILGVATVGKRNLFTPIQFFASGLSVGTGEGNAIRLGTDVNLYRSASNRLRTDDAFWASSLSGQGALTVGGDATIHGALTVSGVLDFPSLSLNTLQVGGGAVLSNIRSATTTIPAIPLAANEVRTLFVPAAGSSGFTQTDAVLVYFSQETTGASVDMAIRAAARINSQGSGILQFTNTNPASVRTLGAQDIRIIAFQFT